MESLAAKLAKRDEIHEQNAGHETEPLLLSHVKVQG